MHKICLTSGLLAAAMAVASPALARVDDAAARRDTANRVTVTWRSQGPVDLYVADRADAGIASARLVSGNDRDGQESVALEGAARAYFLIRDRADGSVSTVAERLVPLDQGSNFRDLGGYAAHGGKRVRWGMIFRSGATPLLSEADLAQVRALGLRSMVDLRSGEERQLAPSRIDGVAYSAIGYRMGDMTPSGVPLRNGVALYRGLPAFLAPQLKLIFAGLLGGRAPLVYNCSAGQDRTGFASAMVLSALGVPRDEIVKDYLLSTQYRRPQFEMPPIDAARYPGNPVAELFAGYQGAAGGNVPQPLVEADGTPFLTGAFAEIDEKWGSVDAYLKREVGLSDEDIAALRASYLE